MPARYYGAGGAWSRPSAGSTRSYYSGGGSVDAQRARAQQEQQSRIDRRREAFARPATGQFEAGALSAADPRRTSTVAGTTPSQYPLVTVEGRTGYLVPQEMMQGTQTDFGSMTEGFAGKLAQAQAQQAGGAAPSFGPSMEGGFSMMQPPGEQQIPGGIPTPEQAEDERRSLIERYFSFDTQFTPEGNIIVPEEGWTLEAIAPGSFGANIFGALTKKGLSKVVKKGFPGIISKTSLRAGGVKAASSIKNWFSKYFTRPKLLQYTGSKGKSELVLQRTLTAGGVSKAITYTAATIGIGYFVLKDAMGGQATGERDIKEELGGMLSMYARDMARDKDYEAMNMFFDMAEGAANDTATYAPFGGGVRDGARTYAEGINEAIPILREHYAEMEAMEAKAMTPEETANFWESYHARVEEKITLEEQKRVDHFNTQKLISEQQILQARTEQHTAKLKADRDAAAASAKFWLEYQKKLAKIEEEERKKAAEFWLKYKKMVLELEGANRTSAGGGGGGFSRSTLGFGLLR